MSIAYRLRPLLARFPPLLNAAEVVRWRMTRPSIPAGQDLRLHLGCGDIDYPGFVNIDGRPAPHVHRLQRIDKLDAFADQSASLIYACHCLEHFGFRQVPLVMKEWRRVLKPGGIVRISVPDFDHLVNLYLESGRDVQSIIQPLMGGQDYAFNFHYTCFNRTDLSRLLVEAGFRNPREWHPGTDTYTSVPDWSGKTIPYRGREYPVSLNVEADG